MHKLFYGITSLLLAFFLFLCLWKPLPAFDQDLGRHLLFGKLTLSSFSVPSTNLLSYTNTDFPFVNHHWLTGVVFYSLATTSGIFSLYILTLFLVFSSFFLLVWYGYKKNISPVVLGLYGLSSLIILFPRLDIRPEMLGWFFLSIELVLLYSYREKVHKGIFLIPLLILLWVQFHISFIIGLAVLFFFLLDYLFLHKKDLKQKNVLVLVGVFVVSCLSSFVNPNGITGALYPLSIFQNYGYSIQENMSIFFMQNIRMDTDYWFLYACTFFLFSSLFANARRTRPIDWMLSIVFTILAFSAVRNLPLFVFTTFIPATLYLSHSLESVQQKLNLSQQKIFLGGLILTLLFFIWQATILAKTTNFSLSISESGKDSLTFFQKENLKGPIFNNFDIGSYIAYRLYPSEKVFVDGRPEAYPSEFFQETYISMQEDKEKFREMDKKYGFNTIVFSHTDQTPWAETFLSFIVKEPEWKTVYIDSAIVILVKDKPENTEVIKEYAKPLEQMPVVLKEETYAELLKTTRFFFLAGTPLRAKEYLEVLVEKYPSSCYEYGLLIQLYQQENNPLTSLSQQRYQQRCN